MSKQPLLVLLFLLPLGACATSQQMYWNHIVWVNSCQGDVQVHTIDYTNTSAEPASMKASVKQDESTQIGLYIAAPGNTAGDQHSAGYKLVLHRGQNVLELNRQQMKALLAKTSPKGGGTSRDWVVQDPSTCS